MDPASGHAVFTRALNNVSVFHCLLWPLLLPLIAAKAAPLISFPPVPSLFILPIRDGLIFPQRLLQGSTSLLLTPF